MTDKQTHKRLLENVRYLEECDPLYGYVGACLRHEEVTDGSVETLDVDGRVLRYNPAFLKELASPDIRAVLRHEYGHVMLAHPARAMDAYRRGSDGNNILVAADLAVNDLLKTNKAVSTCALWANFVRPRGLQYEHIPEGLSFEAYLRLLEGKNGQDNGTDKGQEGGSDQGAGQGDDLPSGDSGMPGDSGNPGDDGDGDSDGADSTSAGDGESNDVGESSGGTGEGESRRDGTQDGRGSSGSGDPSDGEGGELGRPVCVGGKPDGKASQVTGNDLRFSDASLQEAEQESEFMTIGAVKAAKERGMAGQVPGSLLKTVEKAVTPRQPDWRKLLENSLRKLASVRQSWAKRNRRQTWDSPILSPGRSGRQLKKMGLIVDTSGSITNSEYCIVLDMLKSVSMAFSCSQIRIIECDTKIQRDTTLPISRLREIEQFKGGGGTCLVPAFAELEKDRIDVLVCITDGDFDDTITYKKSPLFWLLTGFERTFPTGIVIPMKVR